MVSTPPAANDAPVIVSEKAAASEKLQEKSLESSQPGTDNESAYECPFCVMMRKGGCEEVFKAFMECGEKSDKGGQEMAECLPQFEQLHLCMERNKSVFDDLLQEMKEEEERSRPSSSSNADTADTAAVAATAAAAASSQQQQEQQHEQQQQQQQHQIQRQQHHHHHQQQQRQEEKTPGDAGEPASGVPMPSAVAS